MYHFTHGYTNAAFICLYNEMNIASWKKNIQVVNMYLYITGVI